MKYTHTNIISKDWKNLALFYEKVFNCKILFPKRDLSGKWIDDLTDIKDVHIIGAHLLLPGYGDNGPTLEIFQYNKTIDNDKKINTSGLAHLAFSVENVEVTLKKLIDEGGSQYGKLIKQEIKGVGFMTVVYAKDPEGNIVEIQKRGI